MKRIAMILPILTIAIGQVQGSGNAATNPQFGVRVAASFGDAGFFYSSLSPYGEWIELESGFHVWRPMRVRMGWRPYLYGRWAWTDFGWYWVSSEPFGWAVFHYGRWYHDDYYGWVWVPDHLWGPSWVEWRYNDDYMGWAPLPPYASFSISIGIRFTMRWAAPAHYWNFVRYRHFASPHMVREVVPVEYTRRLIGTTRSAGRYEVDGDRVINRGIDRHVVERRGYTRIDRVEVAETRVRGERFVQERNRERIEVYRPGRSESAQRPERIEARRADRRTSLDLRRVERPRRDEGRTQERQDEGDELRSGKEELRPRTDDRGIERRIEELRQREPRPESRKDDRGVEVSPPRIFERREADRRDIERRRERQQERQENLRERSPREDRKEIAPTPRPRIEAPRSMPERRETPRGSEQGRSRERKRD